MSPSTVVQKPWIGPAYLPYTFSDDANYQNSDHIRIFGSLAINALMQGNTAKYARLRWMIDNLPPGGVANRSYSIQGAFDGSSVSLGVFYFLSVDPNFNAAVDPRPELPTEYFAKGLGILSSRTDWSPSASWFVTKSSWNSIDHQFADANNIAFWRAGEWLTKPHIGYGPTIACSDYQNTLAIENPGITNEGFWVDNSLRGSQWVYNNTHDPKSIAWSTGNGYAFFQSDTTDLYNNLQAAATNVNHASRTTLYLKPNTIVTYDRATTKTAGGFKRYWLNTPKLGVVSGKTATMTTDAGQKLVIDCLLPVNALVVTSPDENLGGQPAQYDPMTSRYMAEAVGNPTDARFLHVLQGLNGAAAKQATSNFSLTAGNGYDGAVVGNAAIAFKRYFSVTVTTTTFKVPSAVTKIYITGLKPNQGYTVAISNVPGGKQVLLTAGGSSMTDAGGVLIQ
jgi:hypothetical protein